MEELDALTADLKGGIPTSNKLIVLLGFSWGPGSTKDDEIRDGERIRAIRTSQGYPQILCVCNRTTASRNRVNICTDFTSRKFNSPLRERIEGLIGGRR